MEFKVFYINLDRDKERKLHMEYMLSELGFEYERMPAIEGTLISTPENYNDELAIKKNGNPLVSAEIGCAASHREIYRRIVSNEIPYTLVFEDDTMVVPNFKQIVKQVISKNAKKPKWEYLTFDYAESGNIFLKRWLNSTKLYYNRHIRNRGFLFHILYTAITITKLCFIIPLTYFESGRNTLYKKLKLGGSVMFWRPLYFAGCYLITLEGAKKLLKLAEPHIIYPADRLPNKARRLEGLRFRAYAPISAKQLRRKFGSNIGDPDFGSSYKETSL